jgi:hypothetical protein
MRRFLARVEVVMMAALTLLSMAIDLWGWIR